MSTPTTTCRAWCTRHQSDPYDSAEPGYCHASVESFSSWDVSIVQGGRLSQPWISWGNEDSPSAADVRNLAKSLLQAADLMDSIMSGANLITLTQESNYAHGLVFESVDAVLEEVGSLAPHRDCTRHPDDTIAAYIARLLDLPVNAVTAGAQA